jgi:hypothetical protein
VSARWGEPRPVDVPALLETAGHSVTALLVTILLLCTAGLMETL